jgi:spermidine/putrescine transport system ATP-binding protein
VFVTNVDVVGVAKSYGTVPVLTDISSHFEEGSFTSLLGPSGSGKTTLLRIIAGFITPDGGTVSIGDQDVTRTSVWARNIGMVFQSYALFPHMSVGENVSFGLARRGIRGADAVRQVERALEMVRLPGYAQRRPNELSGGQQQRVALARAIVTRPSVLLLDEPLSALDRRLRQEMQVELVRIQRESGLTTIFVTHDQEEALTLSDRVAILDRGRIVQIGVPQEVYERPRTRFAAEFLGDSNFMSGVVRDRAVVVADGTQVQVGRALPTTGSQVTLAVRPEKIAVLAADQAGPGGWNSLSAVVKTVIYAGPALTYVIEIPNRTLLKVFAQNKDGVVLPEGMPVVLSWSPEHTIVLED